MKRILRKRATMYVAMFMFSAISMMLVSCDKSSNETDIEESGMGLSDAAKAFVGYWYTRSYNSSKYFMFFSDGTCWETNGSSVVNEGRWSYNETTKILATTLDPYNPYQWQVTLSESESWAGIDFNYNKARSFVKESVPEYREFLLREYNCWVDPKEKFTLTYAVNEKNGNRYFLIEFTVSSENPVNGLGNGFYRLPFTTKEMQDDFTYVGSLYSPYGGMAQIISIQNPYNPSKLAIKLSGKVNATLYPVEY